ncbi:hypothetical protein [Propionivibrio sp.]|uniref:hypothetical protein n=1 Tax=Propionivibrio sp. TaxID=2212460 RepID=UPI00272E51C7|nr:hypothetical protein [Propionivibrio sp.]
MNTTSRNDNAGRQPGEVGTAKETKPKRITKLDRIINILRTRPEGLNRFEAEQFGDHCLNSTIAVIRDLYGDKLIQRWETVPSRFTQHGVRVLRFWLTGGTYE